VEEALPLARRAIERDRTYAPVSDLIGAIHTKLGQPVEAREAFLTSLQFDPHDSTAYTNLGLLELTAGNHEAAANYFAEALWLDPDSTTARQGLQGSRAGRMR
jgi:Flp pilus assembly protein TadD